MSTARAARSPLGAGLLPPDLRHAAAQLLGRVRAAARGVGAGAGEPRPLGWAWDSGSRAPAARLPACWTGCLDCVSHSPNAARCRRPKGPRAPAARLPACWAGCLDCVSHSPHAARCRTPSTGCAGAVEDHLHGRGRRPVPAEPQHLAASQRLKASGRPTACLSTRPALLTAMLYRPRTADASPRPPAAACAVIATRPHALLRPSLVDLDARFPAFKGQFAAPTGGSGRRAEETERGNARPVCMRKASMHAQGQYAAPTGGSGRRTEEGPSRKRKAGGGGAEQAPAGSLMRAGSAAPGVLFIALTCGPCPVGYTSAWQRLQQRAAGGPSARSGPAERRSAPHRAIVTTEVAVVTQVGRASSSAVSRHVLLRALFLPGPHKLATCSITSTRGRWQRAAR